MAFAVKICRSDFDSTVLRICGLLAGASLVSGCGMENGADAFNPTEEVVRTEDRVVRCNTVHSLRLPEETRERYGFPVDENTAVISCSLQIVRDGLTQNLPADISGTATTLTGNLKPLGFREAVTEDALSYVATFALEAKHEVRFDVAVVDKQTGQRYDVQFAQPLN